MKKIILCCLMVLGITINAMLPIAAASTSDLEYIVEDGEITITRCDTYASGKLVIPAKIDGKKVTKIGDNAFFYCDYLTSVELPSTIKEIGYGAFYCCEKLEKVVLKEGLKTIGEEAFASCMELQNINIPSSVREIGEAAFRYCDSVTSIAIPKGVKTIETYTFAYCDS